MDENLPYHQARLGGAVRDVQGLAAPFPSQHRDSYRRNLAALYIAGVHNLKIRMKNIQSADKFQALSQWQH